MKESFYQTTITMNNDGKAMLVLATILTLAVGVMLSTTTIPQQQVSAQNMTAENNMTNAGNWTGGGAGNMTDTEQSGDISSIAINEKGKPADKPVKK